MTTTTAPAASPGTAAEVHQPPPGAQLAAYLAAVAARLAARGITSTLEPIVGTPVLHAEDPAGDITADPDGLTAVSLTPGTDPAAPVECTCIWTPAPAPAPRPPPTPSPPSWPPPGRPR
jgi:hypothetical protein